MSKFWITLQHNFRYFKNNKSMPLKLSFIFYLLFYILLCGSHAFFTLYVSKYDVHFGNYILHGFLFFIFLFLYLMLFGIDKIIEMIINGIISILQIKTMINFITIKYFINSFSFEKYPLEKHIIPGIYIIFYIFLLRQTVKIFFKNKIIANIVFLLINILFYATLV